MQNKEDELEFSRDLRAKISMDRRDHYLESLMLFSDLKQGIKSPVLFMTVLPASYGDKKRDYTLRVVEAIMNESKNEKIEILEMNGTHHVHMIKPKEVTAEVIKFLDKTVATKADCSKL